MLAYVLHLLCQASLERVDGKENFEGRGWGIDSFQRRVFGKNQGRDTAVRRKRNQKVVDLHTISRRKSCETDPHDSLLWQACLPYPTADTVQGNGPEFLARPAANPMLERELVRTQHLQLS